MSKTLKHTIKADSIIEKGIMLFWSKGYNATSIKDIVDAAGIPKGSFYFYFDNKEDFAVKAVDSYFDKMMPPIFELLDNDDIPPKQKLLSLYGFRVDHMKNELNCTMGCMGCNLVSEMAEHNERIRIAIESKTSLVKNKIANVIEQAQNLGEVSAEYDPLDLTNFFEDAGRGAMITMKEMKSAYPIDNYLRMITNILG